MSNLTRPGDYHAAFETAFNRNDLATLVSLYEPDAIIVLPDAVTHGHSSIRNALANFTKMGLMRIKTIDAAESAGVALLRADWSVTGPGDKPVLSGRSVEVLRQAADGTWAVVVDRPFAS